VDAERGRSRSAIADRLLLLAVRASAATARQRRYLTDTTPPAEAAT
jgi:hypothetical protein